MHRPWLVLLPLLACSCQSSFAPPEPPARTCFVPSDAGVFAHPLTAPVPGCSGAPAPAGVFDLATLGWSKPGGVLVVPPSAPGTPLPVVFAFHGAYTSGQNIRARLGLEGPADGGAIFVYPNAVQGTWDVGPRSLDGQRVDTLLQRLSAAYCIDPARISITGFSAGAVFTLFLGCNESATFHALAVVAGTESRFSGGCCRSAVSGLYIHGTADEAIPLLEGQAARNENLGRDGCSLSSVPEDAHCVGYSCPPPYNVAYCEWAGEHEVPDWAGEEIWRFVSAP